MKIKQIASNMTELDLNGMTILFSYQTPVAVIENGIACRKTIKKWSVTTTQHINKWFRNKGNIGNVNEYPQEYFDNLVK